MDNCTQSLHTLFQWLLSWLLSWFLHKICYQLEIVKLLPIFQLNVSSMEGRVRKVEVKGLFPPSTSSSLQSSKPETFSPQTTVWGNDWEEVLYLYIPPKLIQTNYCWRFTEREVHALNLYTVPFSCWHQFILHMLMCRTPCLTGQLEW